MRSASSSLGAAVLCAGVFACGSPESAAGGSEGKALARVNGSVITEADLGLAAVRALGPRYAGTLGPEQRRKLLEGLVLSRAMAQAAEPMLKPAERADLERRVRAQRESLLVEHLLASKAKLAAPTPEEVRAYYDANPTRFGGGVVRRYGLLLGTRELAEGERTGVIEGLREAAKRSDWAALAAELAKRKLPVAYRESVGGEASLHPRLLDLLRTLGAGQTSGVAYIEGRPYVARALEETQKQPRPFDEVAQEIREALVARAKSKALEALSDEILAKAKPEYLAP